MKSHCHSFVLCHSKHASHVCSMIPWISVLTFMSHVPSCKHIRLRFRRYPLVNIYTWNHIMTYVDLVCTVMEVYIKVYGEKSQVCTRLRAARYQCTDLLLKCRCIDQATCMYSSICYYSNVMGNADDSLDFILTHIV